MAGNGCQLFGISAVLPERSPPLRLRSSEEPKDLYRRRQCWIIAVRRCVDRQVSFDCDTAASQAEMRTLLRMTC